MSKQHQKRFLLTGEDKYNKISHRCKILLIKRVVLDEIQIKETAQALNINYSTAKTLMRKFKRHGQSLNQLVIKGISQWYENYAIERVRCNYRILEHSRNRKSERKERKSQEEETGQQQIIVKNQGDTQEHPTPIQIYQQVLFRQ